MRMESDNVTIENIVISMKLLLWYLMLKGLCFRGWMETCLYTPGKLVWGFCFWIDFKQSKLFPRAISYDKITFKDKVRVSLEIPSRISNKHDADEGKKINQNQINIYFHPVRSRGPNLSLYSRCCNRPGRQHLFPFKNQLTHTVADNFQN